MGKRELQPGGGKCQRPNGSEHEEQMGERDADADGDKTENRRGRNEEGEWVHSGTESGSPSVAQKREEREGKRAEHARRWCE